MLFSTIRFVALGWVDDHFVDPVMHFHYFGFEWVQPLPAWGMYALHLFMILTATGIMLGWRYRWSALGFALTFTYCELIDLTYYLNHYYFVSLVSFLLVLMPAHRSFSLDALRQPGLRVSEVPRFFPLLLQLQLGIVYVYAGWAKLNADWLLEALPLRIWLPAHADLPLIGWTFRYEATAYVFAWFGMLYDSLIPLFLWWRPSRPLAYLAVVVFHVMTGLLFQIGVFPLVMMGLTTIFFSAEWHQRLQRRLAGWLQRPATVPVQTMGWLPAFSRNSLPALAKMATFRPAASRWLMAGFALYLLFQLLFPWRYLLYNGHLFWTEEGYRFSWRVMLMEKAGTTTFYVTDPSTGREGLVDNREFLNAHQEKQMAFQPDMILQFAHFLADHYAQEFGQRPQVRSEAYVTLNGRPSQLLIDPQVDLAAVEDGWQPKSWILPYPYQ